MTAAFAPAPAGARWFVETWHRLECLIAVAAFGFIALVLIADVAGRELLTPIYRALDIQRSGGLFAAQKMCVYALVIGSFCGIGVATATGSHLLPRLGFGWVSAEFAPTMDRIADLVSGLFFVGVAWFGWVYVASSVQAGLRMQAFDMPIWPIQLAIPLGFLSAAVRYFFFAAWPALRPPLPEYQE